MAFGSRRNSTILLHLLVTALVSVVAVTGFGAPANADDIRDQQWQLDFLRADEAWPIANGDGVTVAVIDSGVDAEHPDLEGQVLAGADFVDGSTDGREDVVGHGTTVSALIAGKSTDDDGVEGLAPKSKILPIRVLDPNNQYDSAEDVATAIRWAVDHSADVINLSLGSADTSPTLTDALYYAFDHDVVVVACNGNYSNERGNQVWHPARESGVIAVSGVERNGDFWSGSLSGPQTVLAAPATQLTGAQPGGGYAQVQGTSFAAPIVSGAAALLRSEYPNMSAANVVNRLISTAWDFGAPGFDDNYGYGIVNPTRALTADIPSVSRSPLLPRDNRGGSHSTGDPTAPRIVDKASKDGSNQKANSTDGRNDANTGLSLLAVALVACTATGLLIVAVLQRRPTTANGPRPQWPPTNVPPPSGNPPFPPSLSRSDPAKPRPKPEEP